MDIKHTDKDGNTMNNTVAFLDLLGFSRLLEDAPEIAFDNMNVFHNVVKTRYIDNKVHPIEEYERNGNKEGMLNFVKEHSVSTFKEMIIFSDSMVLCADDLDMFVRQLGNFVANIYIRYSSQFAKMSMNIKEVTDIRSDLLAKYENGKIEYNKSFPILFRGGVALGNEVGFWDEICIRKGVMDSKARDVGGRTYLEAVKLEKSGYGPRLFCHKALIEACKEKQLFDEVKDVRENHKGDENDDIYEILWPMLGCECGECSSEAEQNINRAVKKTMLPPAVNLYKFYKTSPKLIEQAKHYEALIKLVIKGIMRYGEMKHYAEYTKGIINEYLEKNELSELMRNIGMKND